MKIIIRSTENYIPIGNINNKFNVLYNSNSDYLYTRNIHYIDTVYSQFNLQYILDINTWAEFRSPRGNPIFTNKGIIFINNALFCIFAFKPVDITNEIENNKEKLIILVDKTISERYQQEFARFKSAINNYGMSSRKQVEVVDDLKEMFYCDSIVPTMDDYNSENQELLSAEFINKYRIIMPFVAEEQPIIEDNTVTIEKDDDEDDYPPF